MSVCFGKGPVFEGNYGKGTIVVDSIERIASLGNVKRSFWWNPWNPHLFGESFLGKSWGWMQATPKFLGKIQDRGGLPFISLCPLSFPPLCGARSSRRLWAVSSHLLRRWRGMMSQGPPGSPRLSMVLKAGTGTGTRDRHRDPGPGTRGHSGSVWRSASVLRRLKEGNTVSWPLLGSKEKGSSMQNYYSHI